MHHGFWKHDVVQNRDGSQTITTTMPDGTKTTVREPSPAERQAACEEHHWHPSGMMRLSIPPQYGEVCCRCGKERWTSAAYEQDPGCGRFGRRIERVEVSR